ncbi:MAG: lysophospholipid acyltransferase family protein [Actinomycetota bacterium]|nr:lysophospholipid acyltransferase family protein [Actinomycetota bacterium]
MRRISNVRPSPLFRDDGPLGARIMRRVRGITLELVAFVLVTVLLPGLLLVAALVDLALWLDRRKPWVGVRLTAFCWWFLFGELRALVVILGIAVITGGPLGKGSLRRRVLLYRLRAHWAASHLGGIRVLFGLHFEVEGLAEAGPGPVTIMMRHASIIDNMLPDALVARTHGLGLRYVIKRELQTIPTIDIGGRWVPTNFVRRGSGDSAGEIARLRALAIDLHEGEGILVYPEGTRFTPAKLERAKEIVRERQPEISPMAERLQHLLPPRMGGPLALIDEAPQVDIVFCGHVGFDGFQHISDIWAGRLVGSVIGVKFWRVPAADVPHGEVERAEWLYGHWQAMDDWIDEKIRRTDAEAGRFGSHESTPRPVGMRRA